MLQKLNERIQGVIAWVVIILIAVTFTMFGVDYYIQSRGVSDAKVTVNGKSITKQAYELSYKRARQQYESGQMTSASEAALKQRVLDEMIVNLVSIEAAKKAGFEVSLEQANSAILSIPQFQEDGRFSSQRYQQALSNAMYTPESFHKEVKQGMLLNQQRFALIGSAFVLPSDIQRFVKLYLQTRNYEYVLIPAKSFLDRASVDENQIQDYYKTHQKEFVKPEQVSIEYVRLSMQQVKKGLKVSDADAKKYYDDNQSNYLTPARWKVAHVFFAFPEDASAENIEQTKQKAEEAWQGLQTNPQQFDEMTQTLSDDKLSIASKGQLPWITAGQTPFDKNLSELESPGDFTSPVRTTKGFEIFKLVDYKKAQQRPFAAVKQQIIEQLSAELLQSKFTQLQEQLSDLSYQSPDSLTGVADAMKLNIEKSQAFPRNGGDNEITKNVQVINAAYSHDVLESGNNSEAIPLDNDSVIVLRISQHFPAAVQPLEQVKEQIITQLALQQATLKAKTIGTELLDNSKDEALLSKHSLKWLDVEKATRDTDKADAAINDLAFSLARIDSKQGKALANGDYVIVRLKTIMDGELSNLDKEQQASIAQQIETSYGLMDYDLYINNLVSTAKIERK